MTNTMDNGTKKEWMARLLERSVEEYQKAAANFTKQATEDSVSYAIYWAENTVQKEGMKVAYERANRWIRNAIEREHDIDYGQALNQVVETMVERVIQDNWQSHEKDSAKYKQGYLYAIEQMRDLAKS